MAAGERSAYEEDPGIGLPERCAADRKEALTVISAYGCSGKAASCVLSSSGAVRATGSCDATRKDSCWQAAGMPVMGSRRVLRWAMDHDGEMRRSDDELGELTRSGTSAALWRDMMASELSGGRECRGEQSEMNCLCWRWCRDESANGCGEGWERVCDRPWSGQVTRPPCGLDGEELESC